VVLRQIWQGLPFLPQISYLRHRLFWRKGFLLLFCAKIHRNFAVANKLQSNNDLRKQKYNKKIKIVK